MASYEEITIPVPWGNVVAKAWNDPEGQPILMAHGLLDNAGSFDTLVPLLPKNFYIVAVDLPGHGKSSNTYPGVPTRIFDYALCIDYIADYMKWDKLIYIRHSGGAYVGYCHSAIFPGRITKFVGLDEPIRVFSPQTAAMNLLGALRNLKQAEKWAALKETAVFTYQSAIKRIIAGHPDGLSERSAAILAKRGLVKCDDGYKFVFDDRLRQSEMTRMNIEQSIELFKRIICPVLHIAASESLVSESVTTKGVYKESEPIREMFRSNLRELYHYHVVEGNHNVHLEYPERVSGIIIEFLTKP